MGNDGSPVPVQQCRRHPRRHLSGRRDCRAFRGQADIVDPDAAPHDRPPAHEPTSLTRAATAPASASAPLPVGEAMVALRARRPVPAPRPGSAERLSPFGQRRDRNGTSATTALKTHLQTSRDAHADPASATKSPSEAAHVADPMVLPHGTGSRMALRTRHAIRGLAAPFVDDVRR